MDYKTIEDRIKIYVSNNGNYCLSCGSSNITAMDFENNGIRIDCNICKSSWIEVYKLVDIEEIELEE